MVTSIPRENLKKKSEVYIYYEVSVNPLVQ